MLACELEKIIHHVKIDRTNKSCTDPYKSCSLRMQNTMKPFDLTLKSFKGSK